MTSILIREILVRRFILITTFRYVSKNEDHNYNFFLGNINKLNKIENKKRRQLYNDFLYIDLFSAGGTLIRLWK